MHPWAPSLWLPVFSLSLQCRPCHSCRGCDTPPWHVSPSSGGPSLWSVWSGGTVQTWRQPPCQTSCRPMWHPHWPLLCRGASWVGDYAPLPAAVSRLPSCHVWGLRRGVDEGTGFILPQVSGEMVFFLPQVVLPGGDGSGFVKQAPDQSPLDLGWMVGVEVQVSICVSVSCRRWRPAAVIPPLEQGAKKGSCPSFSTSMVNPMDGHTLLGGSGAPPLCPSSRCSRCHLHTSSRGEVLALKFARPPIYFCMPSPTTVIRVW